MPRLLVALSAHGYGHASQTAPVVNALRARRPDIALTLATRLPRDFLSARFAGPFRYLPMDTDVGMVMASAIEVKVPESLGAYRAFHARWDERVAEAASAIAREGADAVLANVPYAVLAAAARLGVPAAAMCSLNWADVYAHYADGSGNRDAARRAVHEQILDAYRAARVFLRLTPGMPMPGLPNALTIGPVARLGRRDRDGLRARLGLAASARVVMIAPGGIEWRLPVETWPASPVHYVVPASWEVRRRGFSAFESLGLGFVDALASSDGVVGKPGYGTFAEAACNGVPVVYVRRGDWPEEPALIEWIATHARAAEIDRAALARGAFGEALERLWAAPPPPAPAPSGVDEAARVLLELLDAR